LKWGSEHESKYSEEDLSEEEQVDWIDSDDDEEKKDDIDDDKSIDLEMTDDEETDDEVLQGKEQVNDDDDEDMSNAKVKESRNDDEEDTNAAKADAEKTEEAKDDPKKAELPSAYLILQMLRSILYWILKFNLNLYISIAPVTTLPPPSVSTIPPVPLQQTTAPILTSPITTDALTIITAVPVSDALFAVQLRVAKLEKNVSELKKIDHSAKALTALKSQVPRIKYSVKPAPKSSKIQTSTINPEQESEKSALGILKIKNKQAEKQKMPKYTIKSTDKVAFKE
ncbi:hypothetical protein Tco_1497429, partial [Tanacetum coccineum]